MECKIEAINVSKKKGVAKEEVPSCRLDHLGIVGDAHAGEWHRQVSLLSWESVQRFAERSGYEAKPGAFGENLLLSELDFSLLHPLDRLTFGEVELEVTQAQIAEALAEPVQQICEAVMVALETTPPDLAADIVDRGVMLTGGGALLGELDLALREQTGLSISVADESLNCVALGTGRALEYEKQLRHVIDYDS